MDEEVYRIEGVHDFSSWLLGVTPFSLLKLYFPNQLLVARLQLSVPGGGVEQKEVMT